MGTYPALSIRPPEQPDVIGQAGKVLSLQSLLQGQQLQQQQITGAQQENQMRALQLEDQQTIQKIAPQFVTKDDSGKVTGYDYDALTNGAIAAGVRPQSLAALQTMRKNAADTVLAQSQGQKNALENQNTLNDQARARLDAIKSLTDPGQRQAVWQDALTWGQQNKVDVSKYPAQVPDNTTLQQLEIPLAMHSQAIKEATELSTQQKNTAQGQEAAIKAQQAARVLAGTSPQGISAEQQATLAQGGQRIGLEGGQLNVARGRLSEEMRHNLVGEGGPVTNVPAGVTGDAALQLMDPQRAAAVKLIGDAHADFATFTSRMPPGAKFALAADIHAYNPNFNQQTYEITKKVGEDLTSGGKSNQLLAFNTAINHMATFSKLADALDNRDTKALNSIGNAFSVQFGSDAVSNFSIAKAAFSGEVGKAFAGANVGEGDRNKLDQQISAASSPKALKGAAETALELLKGKRNAMKNQAQLGMQGKADFGDNNSAGGGPAGGYVRIQASDGSVHDIPQQNIGAARQRDPQLQVLQ